MENTPSSNSEDEDTLDPPLVKMEEKSDPYEDKFLLPKHGLVGIRYPNGTVFPMPFQAHTELTCPNCISGILFHIQLVRQDLLPDSFKPLRPAGRPFVEGSFCRDGNGMNCDVRCPRCTKSCQFAYRLSAGYKFPTIRHLNNGTIDYSTDTELNKWLNHDDCNMTSSQSSNESDEPSEHSAESEIDFYQTAYDMQTSQSSSDSDESTTSDV